MSDNVETLSTDDARFQDSQAKAEALVHRLKTGAPRAGDKKRVEDLLEQDDGPNDHTPSEFTNTKASRTQKRKWAAKQRAEGNLPTPQLERPKNSAFGKVVIVLMSTFGLGFFGYRMYLKHYVKGPETYLLYDKETFAKFSADRSSKPMIGILGEAYDVSSALDYYGKGGHYAFFTGTDASRAYITGKFADDLNDDVSDFTDEQMFGLQHWKDFYLKTYKYRGRIIGAFFDEGGHPTQALQNVLAGAARWKASEAERKAKRAEYPACNKRWSQKSGGEVWCDEEMYPRLVTEMVNGQAEKRCACFKRMGWSDSRAVYPGCKPDAHRCVTSPPESAAL